MAINEYLYIKYLKTAELQRTLNLLNGNKVALLNATRAYSKNVDLLPIPNLPYIKVNELKTNKLKIDFNYLINGDFSIKETFNLLNSVDEEPLSVVIHNMGLFCHNNDFIGDALADETNDDRFKNKEYVAIFKSYPISREGETNKFVEEISNFRTSYEQGLSAYKLHSLDFQYVISLCRWREICKLSKATKEYNIAVENWTNRMSMFPTRIIKQIVENIFPKEYTSGRTYKRGTIKGKWILEDCGSEL